MKFSELWLREWIDTTLDTKILLNQLTMSGLEVNDIKPVANSFNDVIIGEIVSCHQFTYTNKVFLTKINIGRKKLLDIICTASNCREGLIVAVAIKSSSLFNKYKIKSIGSYNELSEGILCTSFELGITNEKTNIIELPSDAPIGTDIRKYLYLDDNIIELTITPNRADCLSIIGIARDIAILNKIKLKVPNIKPIKPIITDTIEIEIKDTDACPKYLARMINGINFKALTPVLIKEKLRRSGITSINVITDIANFILLELGQPIHIFDSNNITGGIIVRMAKHREVFLMTNNDELNLREDTLVITDQEKILAIGGFFSGKHAALTNKTQNLLLTCAYFNPLIISECIHNYKLLHNDVSSRYERGIDPNLQHKAMERITNLIIEICGGNPGPISEIINKIKLPRRISLTLHRKKIDRLIGYHIPDKKIYDILHNIGCKITYEHKKWQIIIPTWRFDINLEEDLIEEILRIYGYNNIPNNCLNYNPNYYKYRKSSSLLNRVKFMLNDKGYQEVITYSFVNSQLQKLIHPEIEPLILNNPISEEMSVMRVSLWSGLIKTIIYNQNRKQARMKIFETGIRFIPDIKANLGVRQDFMLAGAACGSLYKEHWDMTKRLIDFYDIKGDIEAILNITGRLSKVEFRAQIIPALQSGQSAAIYLYDECIGFIGKINPKLKNRLNLHYSIIMFELEWKKIIDQTTPKIKYVSRFPINRRDISIIVRDTIPAVNILKECKKINVNHIIDVNLFDIYKGNGIKNGYKSLAISLFFQDFSKTLEKEEIDHMINNLLERLKIVFQASLR